MQLAVLAFVCVMVVLPHLWSGGASVAAAGILVLDVTSVVSFMMWRKVLEYQLTAQWARELVFVQVCHTGKKHRVHEREHSVDVTLIVETCRGNVPMRIQDDAVVGALKQAIEVRCGIPAQLQAVWVGRMPLDDTSKILSDYGVCNHSTIRVRMGIIGGAKKRKVLTPEEKKQREEIAQKKHKAHQEDAHAAFEQRKGELKGNLSGKNEQRRCSKRTKNDDIGKKLLNTEHQRTGRSTKTPEEKEVTKHVARKKRRKCEIT